MIAVALERHKTVKAVSVAPSRGAEAAGARAGRHSRFGEDDSSSEEDTAPPPI